MRSHTTPKGVVLLSCERWKACGMVAAPEVLKLLDLVQIERDRNALLLEESRKATLAMADKYADARNGAVEPECGRLPVKLGTYIDEVTKIAVERSRRNGKS